ncbi:MAG TPA: SDR family NAD(P)-dependent oxidoreductase [Xanthobacteraceae bacterium]|nr:SDR family NAD(P)-dependent oxidoreductase [Xanthobacteraceae bacterium]
MKDFAGKVAVVTGAASGIGLGLARAFVREGMSVAMCDIRIEPLNEAREQVAALGQGRVIAIQADVSDAQSVENAARKIESELGKIHVVCNNAGVVLRGHLMEEIDDETWDWVIGTNLYGLIHGIQSFVPRIRAHGEGGHIINTASMAGLQVGNRQTGAYAASKFAVVALSEALAKDLKSANIGVSVLTPAGVATEGYRSSAELRGGRGGQNLYPDEPEDLKSGLKPDQVARRVLDGVRAGQFFLITHPETRPWVEERHARLMAAYDFAEQWKREHPND